MFPLKDRKNYISCVIYKGDCSCGSCYISETKRVAEVRWNEHNNPPKSSEPSKHLRNTLHGLSFQMLQRMVRPGRTQKHHILLSRNLILTNKTALNDQFYLEMVPDREINDLMQTPKKEGHFSAF